MAAKKVTAKKKRVFSCVFFLFMFIPMRLNGTNPLDVPPGTKSVYVLFN